MNSSSQAPVFVWFRLSLDVLIVGLAGFVIVRGWGHSNRLAIVVLALTFLGTYAAGTIWLRHAERSPTAAVAAWLTLLTGEALGLGLLSPDAAYLVFPLFFLYLLLIPGWWGAAAVSLCALLAILVMATTGRLTAGGVIGPLVAASVAVILGLGYRELYRENVERQRLIVELLATREELFQKEREAGILSERARLAREIHDTVAQGLASIQLLLHAAERADGDRPGIEHVRLARETAALNLEETRRFIRALTPTALAGQTLASALARLAESTRQTALSGEDGLGSESGLDVIFRTSGNVVTLPTDIETALLRIAQGALANVVQHSGARRVVVTLTYMEDAVSLDIVDEGNGFDPAATVAAADKRLGQSFGLVAMRERVEQLGGEFTLESMPGSGTAVAITFGVFR